MISGPHLFYALLSGTAASLGGYLACSGTGTSRWIGLAVLASGIISLALSLIEAGQQRKKIAALHSQLTDFLEGRIPSPRFSVDDDDFALLGNAVVELESRLLLEQEKARREFQNNVEFIADVSHQLKTPLAALKLYCEMERTADPACPEAGIPALRREAGRPGKKENRPPGKYPCRQLILIERMEHLIKSLLKLEKLRADAYEMHYEDHHLPALVWQIWEELQPLYPHTVFRLTGSANLRCDARWIGEALQNILKNACENTPAKGRIWSCIETTERSFTITIEDNGGGIPEKELPGLFRRFYRSSRRYPDGGVGLGLAIARTIVEKHHGLLTVENTAQGLKISLCFPRLEGIQKAP